MYLNVTNIISMNFFLFRINTQHTTHISRHVPTIDVAQQYITVCITLSNSYNNLYLKLNDHIYLILRIASLYFFSGFHITKIHTYTTQGYGSEITEICSREY